MSIHQKQLQKSFFVLIILFFCTFNYQTSFSQSLYFPSQKWGISFGNSKTFSGLRFNILDNDINKINGINITFWKPDEKHISGRVNGLSIGIIPRAGKLHGIQLGVAGVGAEKELKGVSVGLLGIGCGGTIGGINIGGIGIGAGENMWGLNIGLIGIGAGKDLSGINIGGIGVGAGENVAGLNIGLLGIGAGNNLSGLTFSGFGAGAGNILKGITICGFAAGAPSVQGITLAGIAVGGVSISGLTITPGAVLLKENGNLHGLAISTFNFIKGKQRGVSIGIVNYAYQLKGIQIGLINIVLDNPKFSKVLPIINVHF